MRRLRGKRGSEVRLGLERRGIDELVEVTVVRDKIPIRSLTAALMLTGDIAFVKLDQFARTSHTELLEALSTLRTQGMRKLILDLRGNSGGFLDQAIAIANEFLPADKLIVYTEDRNHQRIEQYSDGTGSAADLDLAVLVDEGSASSSEILAGALQDNDRGTIIGRRSFGKGLVQQQIPYADGSALRLTVARYYTPTGRSIQKPYTSGDAESYDADIWNRYQHNEFFSADSIRFDNALRRTTPGGKVVYGGGGIMPDVFVPQDTTGVSSYLIEVGNKGLIIQFSFQYTDRNRAKLSTFENEQDLLKYLRHQGIVEQFIRFADSKGVKRRNLLIHRSYKLLERNLYGNIIYNTLGKEAYIRYVNESDATVKKALEILERDEAFPKAPLQAGQEEENTDGKEKRTA